MPSTIPDIVLPQGYVMLSQSASALNLEMDNNSNLFGEVVLANDLCELYTVGDNVLFRSSDAVLMRYTIGSEGDYTYYTYYVMREDLILFKENP